MPHPDETAKTPDNPEPTDAETSNEAPAGDTDAATAQDAPAAEQVDPRVAELEAELAGVRKQLDDSTARLRAVSKAYTDLQADMKEFRERQEAHARVTANRKAAEVVQAFFDPVENLRRSLESPGEDKASILDGLRMILSQFDRSMEKLGLREIPGVGSEFDPNVHEALATMPVTDESQDGKVIQVYRSGYAVGAQVIQSAQVIVGKFEAPAEA